MRKIRRIVQTLNTNANGTISIRETKVLFAKLLGISYANIPDDHPEVLAFSSLPMEGMIDELFRGTSKDKVDQYYEVLEYTCVLTPNSHEYLVSVLYV